MLKSETDGLISGYLEWITDHPRVVASLAVLFTIIASLGLLRIEFISDYRNFFTEDNSYLLAFNELENTYLEQNDVLIAIHDSEGIFRESTIAVISDLTDESWLLPFAYRADSITNYQHVSSVDDTLIVEDLFPTAASLSEEQVRQKAAVAISEPRLSNRLIAKNGLTTGIAIQFQIPDDGLDDKAGAILPEVHQLVARFEAQNPHLTFHITGTLALDGAFKEAALRDLFRLAPWMFLVVLVVIGLSTGSLAAILSVLLLVGVSTVGAIGLAGWFGITLSPSTAPAPMMIMSLAVADAVHILSVMLINLRRGNNKKAALIRSLQSNFKPILITTVTTAIGFLSLNFNAVPPFRDLGNITAIGIVLAFVFSITLLPAVIMVLNFKQQPKFSTYLFRLPNLLAEFVISKYRVLLLTLAPLCAITIFFISENEVNNEFVGYFDNKIEFRRDTDFVMENLTGIYTLEFSLNTQNSNGVADPQFLKTLDTFTHWLRQQPEVVHVSSFSDTLQSLHKHLRNEDSAKGTLPDSRDLAAQYILLYELSLPYGLDLNSELSQDKSQTRVVASLGDLNTNQILDVSGRSTDWLQAHAPALAYTHSSPVLMFANVFTDAIRSMIGGSLLCVAMISVLLIWIFRSFKFGLLTLLPNLVPAGMAIGIWALLAGQINMGVSMVLTMTLGIVVDDTVHFMSKYLEAIRKQGKGAADAIRYAFDSVGVALVLTTIALLAGFLVLGQSLFGLNAQSAQISAIAIFVALIVDFFLLPPLLLSIHSDKDSRVIL